MLIMVIFLIPSNPMVKCLFNYFISNGYLYHVISPSAEVAFDGDYNNSHPYHSVDERSAGYLATGMSEELGKPVVVWVKNDASFRNLASALTEAYYKKIPLVVVTIPSEKPVSQVINPIDILVGRLSYDNNEEGVIDNVNNIWKTKRVGPVLIEIKGGKVYHKEASEYPGELLDLLSKQAIVCSGEGGLSTLIGMAASNPNDKVTGILPYRELLYELNMFGNRNVRNNILIVSYCADTHAINVVSSFAKALDWHVEIIDNEENIEGLTFFSVPSIVIIRKDLWYGKSQL